MNSQIAKELMLFVKEVEERYSNFDRAQNFSNEKFTINKVVPTSDHTATVYFEKSSGKIGLAFFYYIANGSSKGWRYFFPTDSHINGMRAFEYHKLSVEEYNYDKNK